MDTRPLSVAIAAVCRIVQRGMKAAIVRAAMAGWMHPCRAEWLLHRLRLVEV